MRSVMLCFDSICAAMYRTMQDQSPESRSNKTETSPGLEPCLWSVGLVLVTLREKIAVVLIIN